MYAIIINFVIYCLKQPHSAPIHECKLNTFIDFVVMHKMGLTLPICIWAPHIPIHSILHTCIPKYINGTYLLAINMLPNWMYAIKIYYKYIQMRNIYVFQMIIWTEIWIMRLLPINRSIIKAVSDFMYSAFLERCRFQKILTCLYKFSFHRYSSVSTHNF